MERLPEWAKVKMSRWGFENSLKNHPGYLILSQGEICWDITGRGILWKQADTHGRDPCLQEPTPHFSPAESHPGHSTPKPLLAYFLQRPRKGIGVLIKINLSTSSYWREKVKVLKITPLARSDQNGIILKVQICSKHTDARKSMILYFFSKSNYVQWNKIEGPETQPQTHIKQFQVVMSLEDHIRRDLSDLRTGKDFIK